MNTTFTSYSGLLRGVKQSSFRLGVSDHKNASDKPPGAKCCQKVLARHSCNVVGYRQCQQDGVRADSNRQYLVNCFAVEPRPTNALSLLPAVKNLRTLGSARVRPMTTRLFRRLAQLSLARAMIGICLCQMFLFRHETILRPNQLAASNHARKTCLAC